MIPINKYLIRQLKKFYSVSPSDNLQRIINLLEKTSNKFGYKTTNRHIDIRLIIKKLKLTDILQLIINKKKSLKFGIKNISKLKIDIEPDSDSDIANILQYMKKEYIVVYIDLYML